MTKRTIRLSIQLQLMKGVVEPTRCVAVAVAAAGVGVGVGVRSGFHGNSGDTVPGLVC